MKKYFSADYNMPLPNDEHLNLMSVESHGDDLDDLLSNAEIYIEDWHGNEACEGWNIGDLPSSVYDMVERDMNEWLSGREDQQSYS